MKKFFVALVAALVAAWFVPAAQAGGCASPNCQERPFSFGNGGFFQKQPVPAFQAAPWYLYFPYNSYFMTPAPIQGGAFYGPPSAGGPWMNPYFPPHAGR